MSTRLRDPRRRPTHPGAVLREDVLPALGMTQEELTKHLRVSRLTVNELLREKRALSVDLAARLGRLLGTTAQSWLAMQTALELRKIAQDLDALADVEPLEAA